MKKLSDIAEIKAGYPFRSRLEPDPDGDTRVIQMKDVKSGAVDWSGIIQLSLSPSDKFHLREGDVLVAARGVKNHAVMINRSEPNVITSNQFFVVRPRSPNILPAFLSWSINQPASQRYFTIQRAGSNVALITKPALSNLPVRIPPLSIQQSILEIESLLAKEEDLTTRITELRSKFYQETLCRYLENSTTSAKSFSRE